MNLPGLTELKLQSLRNVSRTYEVGIDRRSAMNSKTTLHAAKRKQQRGIRNAQIHLIEGFGRFADQKGNCECAYLPAETADELRAALDKIAGVRLVYGEGGTLITVMHETRRLRRA